MSNTQSPHWSVERNLADNGWIRLIATDKGTCAVACDRYGIPLTAVKNDGEHSQS